MSRAVGTVTTTSSNLHLIVGHGPRGPVLTVNKTPVSGSIAITRNDYLVFRLYMLHIFRVITDGASSGLKFGTPIQINNALKEVLYFLYADIAKRVPPGLHEFGQLEQTALALYSSDVTIPLAYYQTLQRPLRCNPDFNTAYFNPAKWSTPSRTFFDMSVVQRIAASTDHQQLLDKALNAVEDLNEIKRIIENTRPEELPILLSAKGTAHITHLESLNFPHSFRRTGAALQMAIYGDDEGVQALLKEYMDPAEYERQAIEAFECVLPFEVKQRLAQERATATTYQQAADTQQKEDAKNLCAELEAAMCAAVPSDFICAAPNKVAGTTSESVTAAVVKFKQDLLSYTQNKPHNRYILERLYQISASLEEKSYCFDRDCFLSQQVIREAQLLMSKRWVQHYARGPYYIAENKDELPYRKSTCCYTPHSHVDIHSVLACLRSDGRCLGAMGRGAAAWAAGVNAADWAPDDLRCRLRTFFQTFVEQKQHAVGACYAAWASKCPQA